MTSNSIDGRTGRDFSLEDVDLSRQADEKSYEDDLKALQRALQSIQQAYLHTRDRAVIVFEGWDAAGKGGTIKRLSAAMDPRGFKVWPIGAPRPQYEERHYLQRFWDRLPPNGTIAVFDRSWYGRVLVERVEGFAEDAEWQRAYNEINEFERLLADDGARIVKIFLHLSPDVQMERFLSRLNEPRKRWKLSYEDFRNREKWDEYAVAIEEMVRRTSTDAAPWWVVPADDKKHARLAALETIRSVLAEGVDLSPRPIDEQIREMAEKMVAGSSGNQREN